MKTLLLFLGLSLGCLALFVASVAVLFGLGWALMAGAVSCGAAAAFVRNGLRNDAA